MCMFYETKLRAATVAWGSPAPSVMWGYGASFSRPGGRHVSDLVCQKPLRGQGAIGHAITRQTHKKSIKRCWLRAELSYLIGTANGSAWVCSLAARCWYALSHRPTSSAAALCVIPFRICTQRSLCVPFLEIRQWNFFFFTECIFAHWLKYECPAEWQSSLQQTFLSCKCPKSYHIFCRIDYNEIICIRLYVTKSLISSALKRRLQMCMPLKKKSRPILGLQNMLIIN